MGIFQFFLRLKKSRMALATTAQAVAIIGGIAGLYSFTQVQKGDTIFECFPSEADREIKLIDSRPFDKYVPSREQCKQFLRECKKHNIAFRVKAVKSIPWEWHYDIKR